MSENESEKKLFPFFQRLDLNLGPHDPQSNALSVRPQRQRKLKLKLTGIIDRLGFGLFGLQMTSEVKSDLKFEISDLDLTYLPLLSSLYSLYSQYFKNF